jgi:hypothetical protein
VDGQEMQAQSPGPSQLLAPGSGPSAFLTLSQIREGDVRKELPAATSYRGRGTARDSGEGLTRLLLPLKRQASAFVPIS